MTTKLIAFHGDPKIKRKYLDRVRRHREADDLIQGQGWDDGKGCAIGCTLDAYDHSRYPVELGVPLQIAHLEDAIFEGLPKSDAMEWPSRFLKAIPVGSDLSLVWPRFAVWMLRDLERETEAQDMKAVLNGVATCYERRIAGDEPSEAQWKAAGDAAWDAGAARDARAARAARAAWAARDARAAWAAMDARAAMAARAARAAWDAWAARDARAAWAAWAAKRDAFWRSCADKLEELLKAAPIARKG